MSHAGHPIVRLNSAGEAVISPKAASRIDFSASPQPNHAGSIDTSYSYPYPQPAEDLVVGSGRPPSQHFWPASMSYPRSSRGGEEEMRSSYDRDAGHSVSHEEGYNGDGFLGEVAQWTREDDRRSGNSSSTRTSKMLGLTRGFGTPGPPPAGPPPRPPSPSGSLSPSTAAPRSPFARAASRFSATANLLRKTSNASLASRKSTGQSQQAPATPNIPPSPSSSLSASEQALYPDLRQGPPVGALGQPLELQQRKSSLPPAGMMSGAGASPPGSPTIPPSILGLPQISPRTTSLRTPNEEPSAVGRGNDSAAGPTGIHTHYFASQDHGYATAETDASAATRGSYAPAEASRDSYPHERPRTSRTPSRHLLQSALDLAQQAVEMDRNNDVLGALAAYREAVDRLRSVMDRVGMDPTGQSRRKSGKADEEGRTLKGIHDAYVERIRLLSSYEVTEIDTSDAAHDMADQASRSTATLLAPAPGPATSTSTLTAYPAVYENPNRSDHTRADAGERTPRSSTESAGGTEGIGSMMLSDRYHQQGSRSHSPSHRTPNALGASERYGSPSRTPRAGQEGQPRSSVESSRNDERPGHARRTSSALQRATSDEARQLSSPLVASSPVQQGDSAEAASSPVAASSKSSSASQSAPNHSADVKHPRMSSSDSPATESGASARMRAMRARPLGLDEELGPEDPSPSVAAVPEVDSAQRTPRMSDVESTRGKGFSPMSPDPRASVDKSLPPLPVPDEAHIAGTNSAQLVNPSTSMGTISQRRQSRPLSSRIPVPQLDMGELHKGGGGSPQITSASSRRSSTASSTAFTRSRSESQSASSISGSPVPPVPHLPLKTGLSIVVDPAYAHAAGSLTPHSGRLGGSGLPTGRSYNGSLISPVPDVQPKEVAHRCFHALRAIHQSMDPQSTGAYLTGAVHLPAAMWSTTTSGLGSSAAAAAAKQATVKIQALEAKSRMIDQLIFHLEIIRRTTGGLLDGAREYPYGSKDPRIPSPVLHRDQVAVVARDFEDALEAFDEELDIVGRTLSKAGVSVGRTTAASAGTGSVSGGKKKGMSGWGSKISKAVERKDKGSDDPDKYVDSLSKICWSVQIIDDHLLSVTGPCTPAYHALSESSYRALETKLYRCAESIASMIVPFVLDDTKQFLLRYLKGGVQYLEDS